MTQLIHMHHLEGFQAALKQNRANVKKSNTSATIKKKKTLFHLLIPPYFARVAEGF